MSVDADDLALAEFMIEFHGAKAIAKAEEKLTLKAHAGNRDSAARWLRVMTLIEFTELRAARS